MFSGESVGNATGQCSQALRTLKISLHNIHDEFGQPSPKWNSVVASFLAQGHSCLI